MASDSDVSIRISAELTEIKGALALLKRDLQDVGYTAEKAGKGSFAGIEKQLSDAGKAAKRLLATLGALAGAAALGGLIKQGVEFNAQLETAQIGIASIIAAQAELQDAQGNTVKGQEAFNVALGLSQDQMKKLRIAGLETAASTRDLVEAFQTAVGPGLGAGLNLDQVRTVTIQLTQAAGALGVPMNQLSQEIRSILDGTIDINSRVATTLGITNEQVKSWKQQGTLVKELEARLESFAIAGKAAADTFDVIKSNALEALDTLAGEVATDFGSNLKDAIKDATTGLFDTENLGVSKEFEEAVGFARELAGLAGAGLADAIRGSVALVAEFNDWLIQNRDEVDEIVISVGMVFDALGEVIGLISEIVGGFVQVGVETSAFAEIIRIVAVSIATIPDGVRAIAAAVVFVGATIVKYVLYPFEQFLDQLGSALSIVDAQAGAAVKSAADKIKSLSGDGYRLAGDIIKPLADGNGAVAKAIKQVEALDKGENKLAQNRRKRQLEAGKPKDGLGSAAGKDNNPNEKGKKAAGTADAGDYADAETKLLKDSTERYKDFYKRLYETAKLSAEDYYNTRTALEITAIDAEIEQQKRKIGLSEKETLKAQTEIELLERKKTDVITAAEREREDFKKKLAADREQLEIKRLEQTGQSAEAKRRSLEAQYKDTIARLLAEGDTAGVELVKSLINTEVAETQLAELEKKVREAMDKLKGAQETAANQIQTGTITQPQAQEQTGVASQEALRTLTDLRANMQLLASQDVPGAKQALADLDLQIQQIATNSLTGMDKAIAEFRVELANLQENMAGNALRSFTDGLGDMFASIADGSKSSSEALRDFARNFAASVASMIARALALQAVLLVLNAIPGGAAVVQALGLSASVKHTGGIVGRGTKRSVDPSLFAGAPRYHSGGIAGLKPGEVPAILQTGEEVLSRKDPRNSLNGGGDAGNASGVRIVNVMDPSLVTDAMGSASGERVIMNVIERNAAGIRQRLA